MKKFVLLGVFLLTLLWAEELKITSEYFNYNMQNKESVFKGNVRAVKGKDTINADKITLYFNKNKKPVKFVAVGNVKFTISLDANSTYKGKADELIYQLNNGNIVLKGNAEIVKVQTKESVKGNKIILNRFTKNAEVFGGKKPVEIIIKVNE